MRYLVQFAIALLAVLPIHSFATQHRDALARRSGHPYLLYTEANVSRLKERVRNEPAIREAWQRILSNAEETLAPSREPEAPRGRTHRGHRIDELCLAYRMTGERKFAENVKAWLFSQFHQPLERNPELMRRDPPWHAGLGTGEACYRFAIAYDSIYDVLTVDERQTLVGRFVENGVKRVLDDWVLGGKRIHSLDTMGHNWWSAIVFGAGVGAMAILDEEPRAEAWLRRVNDASVEYHLYAGSVLENKPATFDPAGGFYESVNYASFAIRTYLPFRLAWINAFAEPPPEIPVLDGCGDYFIHMSYPNSERMMSVDFGDSSLTANGVEPMRLLWANGFRESRFLWYLSEATGVAPDRLFTGNPRDLLYAPTPDELEKVPAEPGLPTARLFDGMGWTTMRSSWERDATLLAMRSGFTWNHAHADAGSFVLFHRGRYVLIDSGHSSYPSAEYDDFFRQSIAHNVVLFNGNAQNPEDTYFGSVTDGSMSHLLDAGDFRYVLADATGPTSQYFARNFRSFLWIGDLILVIDDVKSFEPGQFEWQIHYNGTGERQRHGIDFRVTHDDVEVLIRPLFPTTFPIAGLPTDYPENMRLVEKKGMTPVRGGTSPVSSRTFHAFEPAELSRREKFITAILPLNEAGESSVSSIERLQELDVIGVRIRQNGTVTDLYLNLLADGRIRHRNANLVLENGWETDAYLFAFTYAEGADPGNPDALSRTAVIDGSYLRREGRVVLDSLSKIYLTMTAREDQLDVVLHGQPAINALLGVGRAPANIRVNRESVEIPYNSDQQSITIRLRDGILFQK